MGAVAIPKLGWDACGMGFSKSFWDAQLGT
jgi:hypothetical protein